MAGLVVGGNGSCDGRERNACGGRISISGGLGQLTGGGSVVQAHKATVDRASSIGLNGHIDGDLLDDGVALLADDAHAVDVLSDDLDGGLRLPLAGSDGLQGLLLDGGIPLRFNVTRALDPAEGHGQDRVVDRAYQDKNADTLRFEGASAANAVFSRSGSDLVIKAYGGEDQVTVNNYFSDSYVRHVKFAFDDRTVEHFDYNQYVANANNLIQAMASFGSNNGSGLSSTSTMSNPANPLLAASTL